MRIRIVNVFRNHKRQTFKDAFPVIILVQNNRYVFISPYIFVVYFYLSADTIRPSLTAIHTLLKLYSHRITVMIVISVAPFLLHIHIRTGIVFGGHCIIVVKNIMTVISCSVYRNRKIIIEGRQHIIEGSLCFYQSILFPEFKCPAVAFNISFYIN